VQAGQAGQAAQAAQARHAAQAGALARCSANHALCDDCHVACSRCARVLCLICGEGICSRCGDAAAAAIAERDYGLPSSAGIT
jgi:hypothetical protein